MYTEFFKLKEKPFSLMPKASVFHDNTGISPGYQSLIRGIQSGEQLILLTGDTGTGKTLCAQKLLSVLGQDPEYCVVSIPLTSLPFDEMMVYICTELNLTFGLSQNDDKHEILEMFLNHGVSPISSIVIVIDEAPNLANNIFNELVRLLEMGKNSKRTIQIVAIARDESDLNLDHPQLADFSQRIARRCQLQSLTPYETYSYITYHLEAAGAEQTDFFTQEAAERVYDLTDGHARPINILCDQALMVAASEKENIITVDYVNNAYQQQRFDDTIEVNTSQVSDAINRYINDQEPIVDPDPVSEYDETIENITTEEASTERSEPQILESNIEFDSFPQYSEERFSVQRPYRELTEKKSGNVFWKFTLGTLVLLSITGLAYYQFQQHRIITELENKLANINGNGSQSESPTTTVEIQPTTSKVETNTQTMAPENESVDDKSSEQSVPQNVSDNIDNQHKIENSDLSLDAGNEANDLATDQSGKKTQSDSISDQLNTISETQIIEESLIDQENDFDISETTPVPEPELDDDSDINKLANEKIPDPTPELVNSDVETQIIEEGLTGQESELEITDTELTLDPGTENGELGINHSIGGETPVSAIDQLLTIAEFQLNEEKLTSPRGDNALETFRQVLEIDPENTQAKQGLVSIKESFLLWANSNVKRNKKEDARRYFKKALLVDPDDQEIQEQLDQLDKPVAQDIDEVVKEPKKPESGEIKFGLLRLAKEGNEKEVKTLLRKGAYPDIQDQNGNTPLMLATDRGHLDVVKTLLTRGANPNLKNKVGDTALINAIWNNQADIVDKLLRKKADVDTANNRGWTALMYAAVHGRTELFKKLVDNGANLEALTKDRKTALTLAAQNGQRGIVSLIMEHDININPKDKDGWTPLMHAVANNHATVVQILLINVGHVNQRNNEGWTSLMLAAWRGYSPIVRMLLEHGANKSVTNPDGDRAFDLASKKRHDAIVVLLK